MHPPVDNSVSIVRCDPRAEKSVMALAAQAFPEAERAAYWQAISALARGGHADRVVLLAARENDEWVAAQVAQSLPGRVAVVWPPQFTAIDETKIDSLARLLFDGLIPDLTAIGAHLAQALVAPHDQTAARLFTLGGFTHAADLLYLAAEVQGRLESGPPLPFEIETFTPQAESRLIQLIERTYVETLDCPRIDGFRKTADVVAGYKSVGQFRPELWQIARHDGADVGCLLVNLHRDVKHAEIVYVGLVPEVRGRSWGLTLTKHAQRLAQQANCDRVVLAVDAANEPAIRLYSAAGFSHFDRRTVWIKSLS
jgi:ribosomal protein S18 acetylase RimI-like enzyme